MLIKPEITEYAPYYETYISLLPENNLIPLLDKQLEETIHLLSNLSEEQWYYRYAPNKWSLKEVIGHIADTERILYYRMLAIARGETIPLPGYDDDAYVAQASFDKHSISYLLESLALARQSTIHLLKGLDNTTYINHGHANNHPVTVRALAYIIAGHELHHRTIIHERYLTSNRSEA
ncbi:DinB family protein [Priestia taiwanensis]|uniref:DinB-like domain-containing protein n=1 Tax=Priestia taiwanensis TaxID=1347902 RepID=A0A917EM97_9BACI|nr:DinB family protein [Priestia taiwanensis]MBM7361695.1 putative damage-inducible protein DinB [Priestia taiwanensis]GGE56280.1 hypothetical protein GCM10007140_03200 [Priestia taiwanensis]